MNDQRPAFHFLPRKVVERARAVADHLNIMKNREGGSSKLQSALGRLKPHLKDDEVVIVIQARELADLMSPQRQQKPNSVMEYFTQMEEYEQRWKAQTQKSSLVDVPMPSVYTNIEYPKSATDEYAQGRSINGWKERYGMIKSKNLIDSMKE